MSTIEESRMIIPSYVTCLIDMLNAAGFEAFLVGGCVRDFLLGREIHDYDLTTSATPENMKILFSGWKLITDGEKHGTIGVIIDMHVVEITTFRVDCKYTDHRHPESVLFSECLADDLARRDFTFNAIAYHPQIGYVDLYGGKQDLADKRIRCIGKPKKRFNEDALRIMRGLRFASELGFEIENETAEAMAVSAADVESVSRERVCSELNRLLLGKSVFYVLKRYDSILVRAISEFEKISVNDWTTIGECIEKMPHEQFDRWIPLLWKFSSEERLLFMKKMRFSTKWIKKEQVFERLDYEEKPSNEPKMRWLFYKYGKNDVVNYFECFRLINEMENASAYCLLDQINSDAVWNTSQLAISGNVLVSKKICEGPAIGNMLEKLLYEVIFNSLENDEKNLLNYAKKYIGEL